MMSVMERLLANILLYSYIIVMGIVAVVSAIYLPSLGIIYSIGLTAYFLDFNKRVFGRFFVSFKLFTKKTNLVTNDHRVLFFIFVIAWVMNFLMGVIRAVC
jgi:hypothetical protein